MLPERADEMLKSYKFCLARCEHLKATEAALRKDIEAAIADAQEAAMAGKSASDLDGMPHSPVPGNPTERIAMMLLSGYTPDDVDQMQKELTKIVQELEHTSIIVTLVEAWLKGLTSKERWMIERQIFDGMTYREINNAYRQEYGETCSKDLLRRLKNSALEKIYEIAS